MHSMQARIVITVLAGLLLIGLVGVAGTVTYTNDTNAVATGLELEFSAPATITWHSGKFSKQDPGGFATEFKFSGGSVKPGDTFMISWGPAAVKVVEHRWVTASSGALVPGSDSSADDSSGNTTAAAPEQVKPAQPWTMTDKYGNTDIMDDDDIVLHLGVPASQVEKIVWYRNDITMRFINPEEKVTVLTNDLMKTFDGNPLEHSPASSHTDHAIAGYDYLAKVYLKDGTAKDLETTIESTFRWRPKEVFADMQSNWMGKVRALPYEDLVGFFKKLHNDSFTGISLEPVQESMLPA